MNRLPASRRVPASHDASLSDPGLRLPQAVTPFLQFSTVLREHGFAVSPEQTALFIEAVGLLGPRSMRDIFEAARATLAQPIERRDEFDALYRLVFLGHSLADAAISDDADELQAFDERSGHLDTPEAEDINEVGAQASIGEALSVRRLNTAGDEEALRQFARHAPYRLPRKNSWRRRVHRRGQFWDLRRGLREAVRRDGELLSIPRLARRQHQRRLVLLIDVSGSMKAQTDAYLRFAHTLSGVSPQLEVFTVGTRLTRISRALRLHHREQALAVAASLVADWDGGTRLGDALQAFLGIPRFAGFTRGALLVILSDGLERGEHDVLVSAVQRLSRLAWRLVWLTPLAGESATLQTAAMRALQPLIDVTGRAADARDVCEQLLNVESAQRRPHSTSAHARNLAS